MAEALVDLKSPASGECDDSQSSECRFIFCPLKRNKCSFDESIGDFSESIESKLSLPKWRCVKKSNDNIVLVNPDVSKSLDIQCLDPFLILRHKSFTSTSAESCGCHNTFLKLSTIFETSSEEGCACCWKCHEKFYLSKADDQTSISSEDFNQIEIAVKGLQKLNKDALRILNSRVPLGGAEDNPKPLIMSQVANKEVFCKEMFEIIYQKRKTVKQLSTLLDRYCGTDKVINGKDDSPDHDTPAPVLRNVIPNQDDLFQAERSIPLQTLLQCIVVRLGPSDWDGLRNYFARDIPLRALENISNSIQLFQELETRGMINIRDTEYLSNGLFEIGRVDLVYLLDCIQQGDYSLLSIDALAILNSHSEDRGLRNRSLSLTRQMRDVSFDSFSNAADNSSSWAPSEATTQSSMREDVISDGPNMHSDDETSATRNRSLQRRYRNVPQRTAPSTPFPVQEDTHIREQNPSRNSGIFLETATSDSNSHNTISEVALSQNDTLPCDENSEGILFRSRNSEGRISPSRIVEGTISRGGGTEDAIPRSENAAVAISRGESTEDNRIWVLSREYSCEHYDRYCTVQFACCEQFWPCHRCHNAKSDCGERKLRSRDIKKVKCRRCGKVQDFPKDSARCAECNLKFAEYVCSICQHLTGVQNVPFHCQKCGICRVHGDRSFHCDVCGVCLDVNLRDNHNCREDSAHDECCVCFEDAFTGCQILPCSHKVHKECISQLRKGGMTRCPICRQSFAHKTGKSKKN